MVTILVLPYLKCYFQDPQVGKVLDLDVVGTQGGAQEVHHSLTPVFGKLTAKNTAGNTIIKINFSYQLQENFDTLPIP